MTHAKDVKLFRDWFGWASAQHCFTRAHTMIIKCVIWNLLFQKINRRIQRSRVQNYLLNRNEMSITWVFMPHLKTLVIGHKQNEPYHVFFWLFSVHHAHREWKKIRIRDSVARWRKLDDVIFERRTVYLLHQLAANWPHTFFAFIFEKNHSIFNRDHETFKDIKTTLVINESDTIIYPLTSRHTPMCRTRMRFGNDRLILPNTVGRNSSKTLFKSILSKILRQTHVSLTREPFF